MIGGTLEEGGRYAQEGQPFGSYSYLLIASCGCKKFL